MNFKRLCDWIESSPFTSMSKANLTKLITEKEVWEVDMDHSDLPFDNDKYMIYWFRIKKAIIKHRGRNNVIGCNILASLIVPIKSEVFGHYQQ